MEIIRTTKQMTEIVNKLKIAGNKISLVPTMGYFHDGHLSLMKYAKENSDIVITSLFVNPTQFAPNEDFNNYPHNFDRDYKLALNERIHYIFYPDNSEMYPNDYSTTIHIKGITEKFEGKSRPTHFDGVATIVAKLFNITKPDIAIFGQKDYQQTLVIKKLVKDLNFDLEIIVLPTGREEDGLAMSSRNIYLDSDLRKKATIIYDTLANAKNLILNGEKNQSKIEKFMIDNLNKVKEIKIDFATAVYSNNLEKAMEFKSGDEIVLLIAAYLGTTRLIDNMLVTAP